MFKSKPIVRFLLTTLAITTMLFASSCQSSSNTSTPAASKSTAPSPQVEATLSDVNKTLQLTDALTPMGPSSGVYYEIFVRSFYDTNKDGIGDLNGITAKLDYLQDLGVKHLWLMPINPSPSYHGYDVTDYYSINPDYGTMEDFKRLLTEVHKRDMSLVMDLVVNHTSSEHPWFTQSMKGIDHPKRNWYMWAEDLKLDPATRGAWGQQAWHQKNGQHYLGIFWEGMPDLHMDNPDVRAEIKKAAQFWLKLGVDGFRLDAAKHVYEDFQNTSQDPAVVKSNQLWWQEFRKAVNEVQPDTYLVGEVWDSPAVIGPYLNEALNSAFNFDLSKRLISMVADEKDADVGAMLSRIYTYYSKQSNGQFVDAPFLSNHDGNRVMSELGSNVNHAKMAASVLLTLPGNPFIYYGEEIGMLGMKPDERLREPMQWSMDAKADGMTSWEPAASNEKTVSAEQQMLDPQSLWHHYKKLITYRNSDKVLQNGGIQSYTSGQDKVAGYIRATKDEVRLVLHNLSSTKQEIKLQSGAAETMKSLVFSSIDGAVLANGTCTIPPYSTVVLGP
ncbi:alpha-amylase family glycosyl hydrolase [Paenibacillus sp. UMB4589-SE434]|uniref:alpha-amylase family glycosyl hydrolase n=1 Tax=Paenibacillus sp. UMB4589-SE434 TaxID=3046314 RepID=UPI00254AD17A|nr:alpha-amylase family glycosyl hydrolase [Paenibacillus sp. UMB4589-SE434]MDK8181688.1 alpha-amylase family glycosyl hydrolase [Paenibacillus sp. UMB4589-SE434]